MILISSQMSFQVLSQYIFFYSSNYWLLSTDLMIQWVGSAHKKWWCWKTRSLFRWFVLDCIWMWCRDFKLEVSVSLGPLGSWKLSCKLSLSATVISGKWTNWSFIQCNKMGDQSPIMSWNVTKLHQQQSRGCPQTVLLNILTQAVKHSLSLNHCSIFS